MKDERVKIRNMMLDYQHIEPEEKKENLIKTHINTDLNNSDGFLGSIPLSESIVPTVIVSELNSVNVPLSSTVTQINSNNIHSDQIGLDVDKTDNETETLLDDYPKVGGHDISFTSTTSSLTDCETQTDDMAFNISTQATLMQDEYSETDSEIQDELEHLKRERLYLIELMGIDYNRSRTWTDLIEAKLNYAIGQTDLLLNAIDADDDENIYGNQKHIQISSSYIENRDYKERLKTSKDMIEERIKKLELVKARKIANYQKRTHEIEKQRLRRQAEIDMFKQEREREEMLKRARSTSPPKATSFRRPSKLYLSETSSRRILTRHIMTPRQHAEYLINLRRTLVSSSSEVMHAFNVDSNLSRMKNSSSADPTFRRSSERLSRESLNHSSERLSRHDLTLYPPPIDSNTLYTEPDKVLNETYKMRDYARDEIALAREQLENSPNVTPRMEIRPTIRSHSSDMTIERARAIILEAENLYPLRKSSDPYTRSGSDLDIRVAREKIKHDSEPVQVKDTTEPQPVETLTIDEEIERMRRFHRESYPQRTQSYSPARHRSSTGRTSFPKTDYKEYLNGSSSPSRSSSSKPREIPRTDYDSYLSRSSSSKPREFPRTDYDSYLKHHSSTNISSQETRSQSIGTSSMQSTRPVSSGYIYSSLTRSLYPTIGHDTVPLTRSFTSYENVTTSSGSGYDSDTVSNFSRSERNLLDSTLPAKRHSRTRHSTTNKKPPPPKYSTLSKSTSDIIGKSEELLHRFEQTKPLDAHTVKKRIGVPQHTYSHDEDSEF